MRQTIIRRQLGVAALAAALATPALGGRAVADPAPLLLEVGPLTAADVREAPKPPWAAVLEGVDDDDLRASAVAGPRGRTFEGFVPVRWFSDGTLLLSAPHGHARVVVWDPAANRIVAKTAAPWGSRLGGQHRQSSSAVFYRHDKTHIAELSSRLTRRLYPLPQPAKHVKRIYRSASAVRVGDSILVPFTDVSVEGMVALEPGQDPTDDFTDFGGLISLDQKSDIVGDGVVVIRGKASRIVMRNKHVVWLELSSDYRRALAVRSKTPQFFGSGESLRMLELSAQGRVVRSAALPATLGLGEVHVRSVDADTSRLAAELAPRCISVAECAQNPLRTWQFARGQWRAQPSSTNLLRRWQGSVLVTCQVSPGAYTQGGPARTFGPVQSRAGGRITPLFGKTGESPLIPGSLLAPRSTAR